MSAAAMQRSIVDLLNAKPFERGLTLIGFDAVEPLQLVQILNDVLVEIGSSDPINVRDEEPEDTLKRILKMLQFLKYKPPQTDMSEFRAGLIGGQREIVYPILEWLLNRLQDLKVRAYLAKYLVPIKVPPDMLTSPQLATTHDKYTELMEEFKEMHKEVENFRKSEFSVSDIKRDITQMDTEKDQLAKRIERLRRKTERLPAYEDMLAAARELRKEHEREDQLKRAENEQATQSELAENKLKRALEHLQETKENGITGGPDGLLAMTEEEHRMVMFLESDKIPKELAEREATIAKLQTVVHEPAMSRGDLDQLHDRINELTAETNKLIEQRMINNNSDGDRQLALYRQQASIISSKKESTVEKYEETAERLQRVEAALKDKRANAQEAGPHRGLKEFKDYVTKLRVTSTEYKMKKGDMQVFVSENATLELTQEILERQNSALAAQLGDMEDKKGITGYTKTQETLEEVSAAKADADAAKGLTVEEHAAKTQQLTENINAKKSSLAPLIQELRSARADAQTIEVNYVEKKAEYKKIMKDMDRSKAALEKEVRAYRTEVESEESRYHQLNTVQDIVEKQLDRIKSEMQLYVSNDSKKKTFRDICHERIQKLETTTRHLSEKKKLVEDGHDTNMRQLDMWRDLTTLMEVKTRVAAQEQNLDAPKLGDQGSDRMVL